MLTDSFGLKSLCQKYLESVELTIPKNILFVSWQLVDITASINGEKKHQQI